MKPEDWLSRAEMFLRAARRNLEAGDYAISCFDSQQAAELALKALHICRFGSKPYTHNLVALAEPFGLQHDFLLTLSLFYTLSRYPESESISFSREMALRCVETASEVVEFVRKEMEGGC